MTGCAEPEVDCPVPDATDALELPPTRDAVDDRCDRTAPAVVFGITGA